MDCGVELNCAPILVKITNTSILHFLSTYIITTLFSENFNRFRAENGTAFGFKRGRKRSELM